MNLETITPADVVRPPDAITFWVIYNRPLDFPESWVLRAQFSTKNGVEPHNVVWTADTKEKLVAILPRGCTFMGRQPDDNPYIDSVFME